MRAATETEVLAAVAACGPWPLRVPPGPGFVRPEELDGVGDRISDRLGGAPKRVGESTYLLGLAARVWSVTLGCVARDGILPDPRAIRVRDEQGAVELALEAPIGWADVTPAFVHEQVIDVLRPVVTASALSDRLMWGNVASALHAIPRVLGLQAAQPWVAQMLELPPLRGEIINGRRTTCCLFYEAGGGLCEDCVLDRIPAKPVPEGKWSG